MGISTSCDSENGLAVGVAEVLLVRYGSGGDSGCAVHCSSNVIVVVAVVVVVVVVGVAVVAAVRVAMGIAKEIIWLSKC